MSRRLTRRDLLEAVLGVPFAVGLAPAGCDDSPEAPEVTGELLGPSQRAGHRLREGGRPLPSAEERDRAPVHRVRTLIVGGGPAGLSAAWRLIRRGHDDVRVLELEPRPGGTSVAGASEVTGYPWGAHYLPVPSPRNRDLLALLREMGAVVGTDDDGRPRIAEHLLVREPAERLFYRGYWYRGLYPYAGASRADLAELHRFRVVLGQYVAMSDGKGRRAFDLPIARCSDDPELTALDRLSARRWLEREGFRSRRLAWLVDYACRDDYGLGLDDTSAWAALFYWAARMERPGGPAAELITWPEGNGALVRHLTGAVGPERLATGKLVTAVSPQDGGVRVDVLDVERDRPERWQADRVIVAAPRFVARRIVGPLSEDDEGDQGFTYASWMVANLHLDDRPGGRGFPPAWDNVIHDSPSLGYVSATHQRGRDFGPTVWTYYLPLVKGNASAARRALAEPTWDEWRGVVMRDLSRAHPDLQSHLRRMDVWRWGHAMVQPRVGFLWSRERREAHRARGPIHFAHSDLSGVSLFEEAFHHGVRAADEVIGAGGA